ncbi:MAG: hypothetical protein IJW31_08590 [Lentisphaeria bacterium]|nr:hypothetical protein [Lentisphaeria bacterium]
MNKFKNFTFWAITAVLSVLVLILISTTESRMDKVIKDNHLRYTGSVQGANSLVSFTTVALGSFRGILADLLWLRANSLQEKGDYYEMVQLARWITDLQPEFSGAAAYLAWNMAYNISVTCSFYDDRWRWVNEGLKLLRDRAIIYNPEDPILYKELGWIFQHKIGNVLDDAQQYYKNQLAYDMMLVVTDDPDWEGIAAAPATADEFIEKYANTPIAKALAKANFTDLDLLNVEFRKNSEVPKSIQTALKNDEKLIHELDCYLRGQYLRDKYKLDPVKILAINKEYGEFDWRLPEAQAVYWAKMGLEKTPEHRSLDCERMITQALFEAFKSGKMLVLNSNNKELKPLIHLIPNFDVLDSVRKIFDDTIAANPKVPSFPSARENFMKDAIMLLYNYGRFSKAEEYFKMLQKDRPEMNYGTLETFALKQTMGELKDASYKKTMDLIDSRLNQSFFYIVFGDDDAVIANEKVAKAIYAKHQKDHYDVPRLLLPPYSKIKKEALDKFMASCSPEIQDILKSRLNISESETADDAESIENLDLTVKKTPEKKDK